MSEHEDDPPDIDDVFEELEELEELVDTSAEREQVRETMRALQRVRRPRLVGRLRDAFGGRDAGEAVLGSVIFGAPMVVEDGALDIGAHFAANPLLLLAYVGFGLALVLGILHAAQFEAGEADKLFGVVPLRPAAIILIAGGTAIFLMTIGGRVDWSDPWLAGCQTTVTAIVMALGASLGDILPE